ncbi:hypothetical protein HDU98_012210 [Podochytrium sp. JEL0797]|nr:hypothetical protein HDU98_012210 [Podochytrium sp. JEL0797]
MASSSLTPQEQQQQKKVIDFHAEVHDMIAALKHMTPDEFKVLEAWATEDVCREFLVASAWDHWAASFKLNQTLQWRKELLDNELSTAPTSPASPRATVPHLLPGLQAAYES